MSDNGKYPSPFVEDGYTESAYLAGVEQMHPPLRFAFRPASLAEQNSYNRETSRLKDAELERYVSRWMAGRLVSWDLAQAISPKSVAQLKPRLFYRLHGVILGNEAPDADPNWSLAKVEAAEADLEAAAAAGKPLTEYVQERDVKN